MGPVPLVHRRLRQDIGAPVARGVSGDGCWRPGGRGLGVRAMGLHRRVVLCGLLAGTLTAAAASGCDDGGTAPPSPTGEPVATSPMGPPSATPEATATTQTPTGFHDPGTRSGVPAVDQVLEALAQRDQAALRDLAVLVSAPCRMPGSEYGEDPQPECWAGVPAGTPVQAFLDGACSPLFIYDLAEAGERAGSLASPQRYVYAVYEGGFGVGGPAAFTVVVNSGGIAGESRATQISLDAAGRIIGVISCSHISPELWTAPGVPGDNRLVVPPIAG